MWWVVQRDSVDGMRKGRGESGVAMKDPDKSDR